MLVQRLHPSSPYLLTTSSTSDLGPCHTGLGRLWLELRQDQLLATGPWARCSLSFPQVNDTSCGGRSSGGDAQWCCQSSSTPVPFHPLLPILLLSYMHTGLVCFFFSSPDGCLFFFFKFSLISRDFLCDSKVVAPLELLLFCVFPLFSTFVTFAYCVPLLKLMFPYHHP